MSGGSALSSASTAVYAHLITAPDAILPDATALRQ
jgi:hypothetical protein